MAAGAQMYPQNAYYNEENSPQNLA
jgi:hypothetical protein